MTVEQRLAKLERKSRNWRRTVIGLAIALGAYLCFRGIPESSSLPAQSASAAEASTVPISDMIRTKRLEIVNDQNQILAILFAKDSEVRLFLQTPDRKSAISLLVSPEELSCFMEGNNGKALLDDGHLAFMANNPAMRRLQDEIQKKIREGSPVPEKEMKNAYNEPTTVQMGTSETHGGFIEVFNPFGKSVVQLQSNKTNTGAIFVYDVNGRPTAVLPTR